MKIVIEKEAFKPVSIVLESQDEVDWTYELFGSVGGVGLPRKFVDSVYYGLEETAAAINKEVFKDTITIK